MLTTPFIFSIETESMNVKDIHFFLFVLKKHCKMGVMEVIGTVIFYPMGMRDVLGDRGTSNYSEDWDR